VVVEVRERLTVSEQAALMFDVEGINLRKQSELEVRKQFQIKISNMFSALENLNDSEVITRLGKTLKGISKPQLKRV
jgi:bifunctional DNA-binding transcriptional regulator/antitoxin component of YhaV-PrlF toxin-antitoxin module